MENDRLYLLILQWNAPIQISPHDSNTIYTGANRFFKSTDRGDTWTASADLSKQIDPATLHGTVVLVRLAHVEAFERRVPYVNPFDRKNLNRVFPGRPDTRWFGGSAEAVATLGIPVPF